MFNRISFFYKIFNFLDHRFKKLFFLLQLILLISTLFESFSLIFIFKIVEIVNEPSLIYNIFPHKLFGLSYFENINNLLFLIIGFFILFYAAKILIFIKLAKMQSAFVQDFSKSISTNILKGYLNQEYRVFLSYNSSEIIRNTLIEVNSFSNYFTSLMNLQNEIAIFIGTLTTILILEPAGAMAVFLYVGTFAVIFFKKRNKVMSDLGEQRQRYDLSRTKSITEIINLMLEIKIYSKEDFFHQKFEVENKDYYETQKRIQVLQNLPKIFTEFLLVFGFVLLLFFSLFYVTNINTKLPVLALFVFAAIKLFPSVNRLITLNQSLRFNFPSVKLLHTLLSEFFYTRKNHPDIDIASFDTIDVVGISFSHNSINDNLLFRDVNFTIGKGEIIGIIGETGSGKSTLVNLLLGILLPNTGHFNIDGISHKSLFPLRKKIGYVPQNFTMLDDTIINNIIFGITQEEADYTWLVQVVKIVKLESFIKELPEGLETHVGERGVKLSGGQKQRIALARALYNKPKLLIFDEGTSSLDVFTESQIINELENWKEDITIIIIAHRYAILKNADRIFRLANSKTVLVNYKDISSS
jgi:ABC-type multidrug transport system fused ATPase/permease subunit